MIRDARDYGTTHAEHITSSTVRARIAHRCYQCCSTGILPGERYVRDVLRVDDRIHVVMTCEWCERGLNRPGSQEDVDSRADHERTQASDEADHQQARSFYREVLDDPGAYPPEVVEHARASLD
jgi:hypothetical protein